MKKPTLCVIFGGKSSEYEVSLRSAYSVLGAINSEKYNVITVGITRDGKWYIYKGERERIKNDTWQGENTTPVTLDLSRGQLIALGKSIYTKEVDVFFPVMHGEFGEDGRIQGLLDICGAKYVGCDPFASHICMDKSLTKEIARQIQIEVAREYLENEEITYPVFVKPCMCGSSVGVSRVESERELKGAVEIAKSYCPKILIEEAIVGCEVEVAVLERCGELIVSPVGEVRHGGIFYGYEEKYKSQGNEYIIPAKISEKTEKYLRECAKKLFLALKCRGLARFDFFVCQNERVVFNEVNTMPGFTEDSMYPMLLKKSGVPFDAVIDALVENA